MRKLSYQSSQTDVDRSLQDVYIASVPHGAAKVDHKAICVGGYNEYHVRAFALSNTLLREGTAVRLCDARSLPASWAVSRSCNRQNPKYSK